MCLNRIIVGNGVEYYTVLDDDGNLLGEFDTREEAEHFMGNEEAQ